MRHPIGIEYRYPSLSTWDYRFLVGTPVGIMVVSYVLEKFHLSWLENWVGILMGCFVLGWIFEVAQHVIQAVERHGYKAAIEDLRYLCIGQAEFVNGPNPPEPINLLAAAIVTLEARSPAI